MKLTAMNIGRALRVTATFGALVMLVFLAGAVVIIVRQQELLSRAGLESLSVMPLVLVIASAAAAALLIFITFSLVREMNVRLDKIGAALTNLAEGQADAPHLTLAAGDELDRLAEIANKLFSSQKALADELQAIALGDLARAARLRETREGAGAPAGAASAGVPTGAVSASAPAGTASAGAPAGAASANSSPGTSAAAIAALLGDIVKRHEALAAGRLNAPLLSPKLPGEPGEALVRMIDKLREAFSRIKADSQKLINDSGAFTELGEQLARAARDMSEKTAVTASGADAMIRRIKEMAENSRNSVKITDHAMDVANSTNETVSKLGEAASEIGKIVDVIVGIADQTKLLSLNAAIEAAGAGDAGKGFAVVAREVKDLARQTARATEDIRMKIEAIQLSAQDTVMVIAGTVAIIGELNLISASIASAVEDQTGAMQEMVRNASRATEAARTTGDGALKAKQIAADFGSTSRALNEHLRDFN